MNKFFMSALVSILGLFAQSAFAVTDVTATTTSIGEAATAALAIGVAVTAVVVAIKLYKWVQRAI